MRRFEIVLRRRAVVDFLQKADSSYFKCTRRLLASLGPSNTLRGLTR